MPPKRPLVITTIERARHILQKQKSFIGYKGNLSEPAEIVKKSVEGNIFRTFGGLDEKPSIVFRGWGEKNYLRFITVVERSKTQQEYDNVIQDFAYRLAIFWKKNMGVKLPYGPATKMINLLAKSIFLNNQLVLLSLPIWYNVPLDSFTLIPLIHIIDELLAKHPFAIPMNQQMTMKYVIHAGQYQDLQQAIRTLCSGTGKTPLDYELWAWDSRH